MNAWTPKRRNVLGAGVAALLAAFSLAAHAADAWPSRPVTVVVPFVAGGTTDIVARLVGEKLGQLWGQPVIIDNRGGAGGNIGAAIAAKAQPDGNTLLMTSGSIVTVNPHIYKDMGFKVSDLVPITDVASGPMVVAVPTNGPTTLKDLIAQAKAKPGTLNFGSAGVGSQVHMAGENFANAAGIDIVHVPYKGEAAAYADLMGGQVQLVVGNIGAVAGFVNQGRLRALAVTSKERSPMLPNVPTCIEAGMPGFENTGWFGFMAPAGTPQAIVDKIQKDTARVLAMPDVKEKLAKIGMVPVGNSPAEFKTAIDAESKRWGEVVKNRHLKVQ